MICSTRRGMIRRLRKVPQHNCRSSKFGKSQKPKMSRIFGTKSSNIQGNLVYNKGFFPK